MMGGGDDEEDEAEVAIKMRGTQLVGVMRWIVDGLESMSAIILWCLFTCLTVKSYLANQSLSLKSYGLGGILLRNSRTFGKEELSISTIKFFVLK